ncbi:MAG: Methyl-accepting transducer protein, partial [Thermodesulfobacteriota bacterium]|nr:Methyl-accepting transducer protein [Thermodesulfobacteriota bacterium]
MFKNMKLGTKLVMGFSVVAAITLIMGLLGYYGAVKSHEAIEEIGLVELPSVDSLLIIVSKAEMISGMMRTLLIPNLPEEIRKRQFDNIAKARDEYEKAWKIYESLPHKPEEAAIWKEFVPAWAAWRDENSKFFEMCKKLDGMIEDAGRYALELEKVSNMAFGSLLEKQQTAIALLDKLVQMNRDAAAGTARKAEAEAGFMKVFSLIAMLIGVGLAMALGFLITRSTVGPIRRIISGLTEGAGQVASASGQVSSASQSLAEGASEQAASIEETSSSLEEMSSMTKQNADNATQADNLMKETKQTVGTANESMSKLTESMKEIIGLCRVVG